MKKINKILIFLLFILISLLLLSLVVFGFIKIFTDKDLTKTYPIIDKLLQGSMLLLALFTVIFGLYAGYDRFFKEPKKRYLRLIKKEDNEYKLRFDDEVFYLKREDFRR